MDLNEGNEMNEIIAHYSALVEHNDVRPFIIIIDDYVTFKHEKLISK